VELIRPIKFAFPVILSSKLAYTHNATLAGHLN